jgi:multidrug/hemolysin transport system ATP-binding protein
VLTLKGVDEVELTALCKDLGLEPTYESDSAIVHVESTEQALSIVRRLQRIEDFEFRHGRMDDVFLALTEELVEG